MTMEFDPETNTYRSNGPTKRLSQAERDIVRLKQAVKELREAVEELRNAQRE